MWSEVAQSAMLAAGIRALGLLFAFLLDVIISRQLGVEGAGIYFLALATISVCSVVGRLGLDNAMLKLIAKYADLDKWQNVKAVFKAGIISSIAFCAVMAIVIFNFSSFIAVSILEKDKLDVALQFMCLGIVTFSMMRLIADSLRGLKKTTESLITSDIVYPVLGVLFAYPAIQYGGIAGACVAFVVATGTACLIGSLFWRKVLRDKNKIGSGQPIKELIESSKPLYIMSLMNSGVQPWVPLLMLGYWSPSEEVALYGVALRLSMLSQFFNVALNVGIPAKIVELFNKGDVEMIGQLARKTALYVTLATSPIFLVFLFFGAEVMGIYGDEFKVGYSVLLVLIAGQISSTLTGTVGYIMIMTGHEKEIRNVVLISNLILVMACLILIPFYGALGAAAAMAIMLIFRNSHLVYSVFKLLGVVAFPVPYAK